MATNEQSDWDWFLEQAGKNNLTLEQMELCDEYRFVERVGRLVDSGEPLGAAREFAYQMELENVNRNAV